MLILYNLILTTLLILASPLLFVKAIFTRKYRSRLPGRLGIGLQEPHDQPWPRPRIWIQALSVGEVRSAVPLVRGLRNAFPGGSILFSTSTATGARQAQETLADVVDRFLAFPLDLPWVVDRFIRTLRPDIFILVETDFWPNLLFGLRARAIPLVLVNGRISAASLKRYKRFAFFFRPMFRIFDLVTTQSRIDAARFLELGATAARTLTLGNLKFDDLRLSPAPLTGDVPAADNKPPPLPWSAGATILIAGSTHGGEDEMILEIFTGLRRDFPDLVLLLAPRHPERARAVQAAAARCGYAARLRSETGSPDAHVLRVLILDTIGELTHLYGQGEVAFVGGSLVAAGGHNPLEPARHGKAVLFGPHMEDFAEIAADLLAAGAAEQCGDSEELFLRLASLLADRDRLKTMGRQGRDLVLRHQGVACRHVAAIVQLLDNGKAR